MVKSQNLRKALHAEQAKEQRGKPNQTVDHAAGGFGHHEEFRRVDWRNGAI
jgi:hypothetical protein